MFGNTPGFILHDIIKSSQSVLSVLFVLVLNEVGNTGYAIVIL